LQYLLTIISLETSSNPSLQNRQKEYTHLPILGKLLYENIVLSIYFYYFSVGRFYISYILPIVKVEIALLRWISSSQQIRLPLPQGKDRKLRLIEEKMHWIVSNTQMESNGYAHL
jgi:hypothetical protein